MSTFKRITGIIALASFAILGLVVMTYGLVAFGKIPVSDNSTWSEFARLFANPVAIMSLLVVMVGAAIVSAKAK